MSIVVHTARILAKESVSDDCVDCAGGTIIQIYLPDNYTDGDMPNEMTFAVSPDGGDLYGNLCDHEGHEISVVARPGTSVSVGRPWAQNLGCIRFRSGTKDKPVEQKEDCTLLVSVHVPEGATAPVPDAAKRK